MGALGWWLLFLGLFVAAIVFLGLTAWRLWRTARALGRDVARAAQQWSGLAAPDDAIPDWPRARPGLSDHA